MSRCRWKACTATGGDTLTPEALFAHLCDSHYGYAVRCERRHFFACEWRGCGELVPCPGSKGEKLLCAVKGHLLDHAEYRPKSLAALRTLKSSEFVSSPSEPEVPATGTPAAVVVHSDAVTPTVTPPPNAHIPHLRQPSHPEPGSPAPPTLDVSVPYSHSHAAPSPTSSTVTPALRTISPTSEIPPPLVQSPGAGFATWKCKWSTCTTRSELPFTNAEDLLAHVLEVHVQPRSPNTPRDVVSVTNSIGRTMTWRKVTCKWSDESRECNMPVVIRAKYVAHFKGHIFADYGLEQLEPFGSTSPVRLTSVPLIPSPPTGTTPILTPTPKRPRGRPRKAEKETEMNMDAQPLKKRLRGNDAIDVDADEATIVVRWGGLPAPIPGSELQPSSSQLEFEDPSAQPSPSEIKMADESPGDSQDEDEDPELDWSLS